ncbi:hypothetical protein CR513_46954, partial [Mucuna pruriens]
MSKAREGYPGFGGHDLKVETILPKQLDNRLNQPTIKQFLRKPGFAKQMEGHVKAQILVDFIAKLTPTGEVEQPSKG